MYFIISNSDGDTSIREATKEELLKIISDEEYGKVGYLEKIKNGDTNYWGNDVLIIKGEIVIPKAGEKIVSYDID